jgi:hypothetical protein
VAGAGCGRPGAHCRHVRLMLRLYVRGVNGTLPRTVYPRRNTPFVNEQLRTDYEGLEPLERMQYASRTLGPRATPGEDPGVPDRNWYRLNRCRPYAVEAAPIRQVDGVPDCL